MFFLVEAPKEIAALIDSAVLDRHKQHGIVEVATLAVARLAAYT